MRWLTFKELVAEYGWSVGSMDSALSYFRKHDLIDYRLKTAGEGGYGNLYDPLSLLLYVQPGIHGSRTSVYTACFQDYLDSIVVADGVDSNIRELASLGGVTEKLLWSWRAMKYERCQADLVEDFIWRVSGCTLDEVAVPVPRKGE